MFWYLFSLWRRLHHLAADHRSQYLFPATNIHSLHALAP